jgi:cell shape-determining protein MreD
MHSNPAKVIILHLIAVLLTVFNINNIKISDLYNVMPLFDLMIIFYFTVYRVGILGFWFLFLLGIWSDALNVLPIGITSICYIVSVKVFNVVNERMAMKENFNQILKQFIAFSFVVLMMKWLFLSIYYSDFYNIISPLSQVVISSVFYVIAHKFFDYLNQKLIEENANRALISEAREQLEKTAQNLILEKVNSVLNKKIAGKKIEEF